VGIASALAFANSDDVNFVYGIQRNSARSGKKIHMFNSGINPFPEEGVVGDFLEIALANGKFECTSEYNVVENSNVLLIDVQTPFGGYTPDYSHLKDAIKDSSPHMHSEMIVSIESTVTPGSTDGWISESIENLTCMSPGKHYSLAHSPERVKPGNLIGNIYKLDRCVGGVTPRCTDRASDLYSILSRNGTNVIKMTAREAEFTKTAENAIRDLQIATANQLALYAEAMGINYYRVADGIKSLKGSGVSRCLLNPGAGVGGHCLVKDTYHLEVGKETYASGFDDMPPAFVSLFMSARDINSFMPEHMFNLTVHGLLEKKITYGINGDINVGILGFSFAENTSDARNSPTKHYVDMILNNTARIKNNFGMFNITIHDPYAKSEDKYIVTDDISETLRDVDVLVGFTNHDYYSWLHAEDVMTLSGSKNILVVDGRNMFDAEDFMARGCIYRGIGRGDVNI